VSRSSAKGGPAPAGVLRTKVTTVRLPEDLAAELNAVSRADKMPASEAVRTAVSKQIAERRADKGFQERLRKLMEEDREFLERLSRNEAARGLEPEANREVRSQK
jgi:hypothetical protein